MVIGQYTADVSPRVSVKVRVNLEARLTRFLTALGSR
jgi:hypothetical protein